MSKYSVHMYNVQSSVSTQSPKGDVSHERFCRAFQSSLIINHMIFC